MKITATVTACFPDGTATVCVDRESACEGCHRAASGEKCSVCTLLGGNRKIESRARNPLGAAVGDTVEVETSSGRVLQYAFLVFLLPVIAALLGYLLGRRFGMAEGGALLVAFCAFLLLFVCLFFYSKLVIAKRVDAQIVSVLPQADNNCF